ncbi:MAG: hydroxyacid dehydrogenase, partial [Candidatus Latescibacteria bacterium]|nr:hydroxyacid dehydrogenase [Candidatus Latescibacterota bacterium]
HDLEVIFSTWGMFPLTGDQLDSLPNLKAVFYAAGTVQQFARPFLERGIVVVSGWGANAVPVAEFTLAQILLSNKNYFQNARDSAHPESRKSATGGPGNFGETVSLLGAGMVGRNVLKLLKPFSLTVLVFDPFLDAEEAVELGVTKVCLDEAFSRSHVVSNHLANLPETERMIRGSHIASMQSHAVFINTGRGATVAEEEMVDVLRARTDLTALLDVTFPEPPASDSPLYGLENVFMTNHIAGSMNNEVVRLVDYVLEDFEAWQNGRPMRYAITLEALERMA